MITRLKIPKVFMLIRPFCMLKITKAPQKIQVNLLAKQGYFKVTKVIGYSLSLAKSSTCSRIICHFVCQKPAILTYFNSALISNLHLQSIGGDNVIEKL